jgi:hypothetical protein
MAETYHAISGTITNIIAITIAIAITITIMTNNPGQNAHTYTQN